MAAGEAQRISLIKQNRVALGSPEKKKHCCEETCRYEFMAANRDGA